MLYVWQPINCLLNYLSCPFSMHNRKLLNWSSHIGLCQLPRCSPSFKLHACLNPRPNLLIWETQSVKLDNELGELDNQFGGPASLLLCRYSVQQAVKNALRQHPVLLPTELRWKRSGRVCYDRSGRVPHDRSKYWAITPSSHAQIHTNTSINVRVQHATARRYLYKCRHLCAEVILILITLIAFASVF